MRDKLALQTRAKADVDNWLDRTPADDGAKLQVQAFHDRYPRAQHRPVGPCFTYNCHGLTFASRRTGISTPSEITKILEHDDYMLVPLAQVLPGDVAVYYSDLSDPEHSGIVMATTPKGPIILSKWGMCHEAIHLFSDCPYAFSNVRYYRVCR